MMTEGVRRMDELFTTALAAGRLERDPTLDIPEPPPLPEEEIEAPPPQAQQPASPTRSRSRPTTSTPTISRWRICGRCRASSRSIPQSINPSGTSYVLVSYRGSARGSWRRR